MFNYLKYATLLFYLRKYRNRLLIILFCCAFFLIFDFLYGELSRFYQMQLQNSVGSDNSRYADWLLVFFWTQLLLKLSAVGVGCYQLLRIFYPKRVQSAKTNRSNAVAEERIEEPIDTFDEIRSKKRLRSRADTLLDR